MKKYFTPADLEMANFIFENRNLREVKVIEGEIKEYNYIYDRIWIAWAEKVIRFFTSIKRRFKVLIKDLKFADLTIKAIWEEIKAGSHELIKKVEKEIRKQYNTFTGEITAKARSNKLRQNFLKLQFVAIDERHSEIIDKALTQENIHRSKSDKYQKRLARKIKYSK